MMRMQTNPPQNRDTTGRFLAGQSGNPSKQISSAIETILPFAHHTDKSG